MNTRSWRGRVLLIWLATMVVAYIGFMVFLWATQDARVFLSHPMPPERADAALRQLPGARHVWMQAPDGTRLHAWYREARPGVENRGVLLYFGGNAEDVHWRLGHIDRYSGWDLLLTDYRGYGLSEGRPGQARLEEDALLWYDHLVSGRPGGPTDTRPPLVMGTSLGSYFATYVAAHRPVMGVALVTPFDSVRDYVQQKFPLVPVRLIFRHPLDSRSLAPSIRAPTLIIIAQHDRTIPPERAHLLAAQWAGRPLDSVVVPDTNHDTVSAAPLYWESLGRFLADRLR
jgi:uncharacterized protein